MRTTRNESLPAYGSDELKLLLQQPNGTEKVDMERAFLPAAELFICEGNVQACAFLCRACKKKHYADMLNDMLERDGRYAITSALSSDNPKLRKNTARLVGTLGVSSDAEAIAAALSVEQTKMAIPSMLLALGALGGKVAYEALCAYELPVAEDESDEKHVREIAEAYETAMSSYRMHKKHKFVELSPKYPICVTISRGIADLVKQEFEQNGVQAKKLGSYILSLPAVDTKTLFSVRAFREVLFPLGVFDLGSDIVSSACAVKSKFIALLSDMHEPSNQPFFYRVEIAASDIDRGEIARRIAKEFDCPELKNSVSDYEVELRVFEYNKRLLLCAKLYTMKDPRFAYRVRAISASIHPSNAAGVLCFAKDCLKVNARTIDVCCGSGTLLFERERVGRCDKLIGVDISRVAIEAAKENAEKARSAARFICKDCTKFVAQEGAGFNELISNLPFGNRVGTHTDNERLYRDIIRVIPQIMEDGATIVLYTMEERLLSRLTKRCPYLRFIKSVQTEAGGLFPTVFVFEYIAMND